MLKTSWCDYSDAYKLVKETISFVITAVWDAAANKKIILKIIIIIIALHLLTA